jgi:predicted N-acetyltransferase YhbS
MTPAAWAGLERAVHGALATAEAVEWIVAEREGEIVGSVMLWPAAADAYAGASARASWPEIRLLAVAEGSRSRGVGQALVEECVRRARRAGAGAVGLHTSRSMRGAIRLYERMGFVRAPGHDFQPEGGELVTGYRLELPLIPPS